MTTTSTESVPEQASASLEKRDFIPAMGTTKPFDDLVDAKGKEIAGIRKLTFYAESVLNGLQVDYQLADGGTYQAPLRGKAKGRKSVVQLAPEEALVQLKGWGGPSGIARLTLTLTSNTGQERVVGPFGTGEQSLPGTFPPGVPVPMMPIPTLMPHGKTLGGTTDQGFSYFGLKAAAFHGRLGQEGLLVGLGVYAAPLVTSDDDVLTSSVLVEDFRPDAKAKHEIASFSNYRSIVTLPPGTEQLDLWAEEELKVTIGTREYTLDPVRKTTVKPNAINKVVIDIDAKDVACPALKLKTATMTGPWQWISLHPDSAAHEKIAGWSADTLHANKAKLGIDAKYSKEECAHVQSAVTNLAKASAPAGNERRIDPAKMDHSDWVLDLGGPKVDYKALSPQEASQLNATAKTTTKAQSALNVGKWLKKKTGSVTKVVVSTAKNTVNDIGETAGNVVKDTEQFGKDLGKAAEHAGKEFLDNAEQVGKDFEKLGKTGARMVKNMGENLARGDFDEFGKDFVRDGRQLAMDVAVTGFDIFVTVHTLQGEALMFVLDHTGKFGKVIGGILRAVGTAIVRLVEFLCDPQNWKAIIKTQKALIETVEKSLDSVTKVDKARLKKLLGARLDQLEKEGTRAFDAAIKKLGGDPNPSKLSQQIAKGTDSAISTVASTVSDALSKPLEALDWLLSKLLDAIPGLSGVEKLISSMLDELKDVLKAMSKALKVEEEQLASLVGQAISDLVALAKDPVHAPELIACMFLNFLKGLLAAGFDLAKGVVDVVIDAMSVLLKFFARLLTGHIDLPGISDLYKFITGQPLTLLGLLALLVAVPTTLIHVMVFGDAPDFQARLASGSQEKAEKGMAIAAYSCAIVESFLAGYLDYRQVLKPARSQELARTESLKTGDNPDDAVGVLDFVKNADTFPIEVASLGLTILSWGCSAPLQWNDKNLEEDATWCWGAVPIVIDIYSMCSSGSRLVRAMETHGPLKDMLLTAVDASLVIKKLAVDPDSAVGTVPDILSVVGGTGQAAMLYSATKAKGAGTGLANAMVGWDVLMGLLAGSTGIALVATGKA